ncbi:MAG: archease [Thermoplasmata archaeon]|uniref:Archease n=1 Tax=Candidatus Sysuiplasma superficiale TaxID=2823368 RepID=A0A8J8CAD0_9ARCH|nr:archease [Candidatus Sysuiplasma superficiale]MBX8644134.1 archease [Candidatus Sysuiplasma superficiale]MCL4346303.1 archease [Candidatus Thermoplasmatota archaeon]MCL5437105.1 archease [Candidatus Thermoplasmatota archaeon]
MRYRLLDHTADIQIMAYGNSAEEIFENSAYALFDQIADITTVKPTGEENIVARARSLENLLMDYLNELLFLESAMSLLFSEFSVRIEGNRLNSTVRGERMDRRRHRLKNDVKAITYHMFELNIEKGYARFIIDV